MTRTSDVWETTAVVASGAQSDRPSGAAIAQRANILEMTQATEDAVLRPHDPGNWPHDMRAALASRIACHNGSDLLAARYRGMAGGWAYVDLADPITSHPDPSVRAAVAFVDQVATQPKDVTADDIKALQAAGIADADIVRLTEVVAFMAYQVRLTAGLALLAEMQS